MSMGLVKSIKRKLKKMAGAPDVRKAARKLGHIVAVALVAGLSKRIPRW